MGILLNKSKNYLINGAMDYWQRATSFTTSTNGVYGPDRWRVESGGTSAGASHARSTNVPSGIISTYSILTTVTSGPDTAMIHGQKIELSMLKPLLGKYATLSLWVKTSNGSGQIVVYKPASGSADSWTGGRLIDETSVYTFNITTTPNVWTKVSQTFLVSLADFSNGMAVMCYENGGVGATLQTTEWQLEEGTSASNFERAGGNIMNELQLCQRYYEELTATMTLDNSAATPQGSWQFKVTKRATPLVTRVGGTGTIVNQSVNHVGLTASNATTAFGPGSNADAEL